MGKPDEETESLRKELTSLADQCRGEQKKVCDTADMGSGSSIPKGKAVVRKVLKGHINKVFNLTSGVDLIKLLFSFMYFYG